MALADLSFKLYTDAGLTIPFGGVLSVNHNTDFSDNPQDFLLYFGSTNALNRLRANSNPGVDQLSLSPTDLLVAWQPSTVYALGATVEPTVANGNRYECTTAGTSDVSEPVWPTVGIGSTVVDGTCVWTLTGAKHEPNEVILGLTALDLDTNPAGGALDIGTELLGGVGNAIEVHIRINNAVGTVYNTAGKADIGVNINEAREDAI